MKLKAIITTLILFLYTFGLVAQDKEDAEKEITVTGIVKNEEGQRLKDVIIMVIKANPKPVNTGNSLVEIFPEKTNMAGKYTVKATKQDSLVFEKDGYWPKKIAINDRKNIDVVLIAQNLGNFVPIIGAIRNEQGEPIDNFIIFNKTFKLLENGDLEETIESLGAASYGQGKFRMSNREKTSLIFTAPGYEDSEEYKVSDLANKDDIIIVLKKKSN